MTLVSTVGRADVHDVLETSTEETHDRCDAQLGVVSWMRENITLLRETHVSSVDVDNIKDASSPELDDFCSRVELSLYDVVTRGKRARERGVAPIVFEAPLQITTELKINLLPTLGHNWASTEGTLPMLSETERASRTTVFTEWGSNSCAVDATLFAGICSGAVLWQADAVSWASSIELSVPAALFRFILGGEWAGLSQLQRNFRRDRLMYALDKDVNTQYTYGEYASVCDLVQTCFKKLPSYSYTTVRAVRCCEGKWVLHGNGRRCTGLDISLTGERGGTLEDCIKKQFESTSWSPYGNTKDSVNVGCVHETCTGKGECRTWVVDRLPPMLYVNLADGGLVGDDARCKYFHDITIQVQRKRRHTKEQRQRYTVVGILVWVRGNHFIGRWLVGNCVVQHDGLKGRDIERFKDWKENLSGSWKVVTVFYKAR